MPDCSNIPASLCIWQGACLRSMVLRVDSNNSESGWVSSHFHISNVRSERLSLRAPQLSSLLLNYLTVCLHLLVRVYPLSYDANLMTQEACLLAHFCVLGCWNSSWKQEGHWLAGWTDNGWWVGGQKGLRNISNIKL